MSFNEKEVLSNYKTYKSPLQKEALESNLYLKGFGEAIDELIFCKETKSKSLSQDYLEGRGDAIKFFKEIPSIMNLSKYKEFHKSLIKS